jgi:hypothetical protein
MRRRLVNLAAFFVQAQPGSTGRPHQVFEVHAAGRGDSGEAVDLDRDQGAVAQAHQAVDLDRLDQPLGFGGGGDRRLAAPDGVGRLEDRRRWIGRQYAMTRQPIEQTRSAARRSLTVCGANRSPMDKIYRDTWIDRSRSKA